jgi:hypothetical protein
MRSTEWRPHQVAWQFGSRRGAAIGELSVGWKVWSQNEHETGSMPRIGFPKSKCRG